MSCGVGTLKCGVRFGTHDTDSSEFTPLLVYIPHILYIMNLYRK